MITYLASYPRSGNALTRVILWQCFGVSVVAEGRRNLKRPPKKPDLLEALEGYFGPGLGEVLTHDQVLELAEGSDGPIVAKTHARPRADQKAIVIVRDGRAAMRSFARFRTEVAGFETSLSEVLTEPRFSWSDHVNAWLDHPGETLLLHYEDLRTPDDALLERIGAFLGLPRIGDFTATVDSLRSLRPTHVRDASNDPGIAEVEEQYSDLFWEHHGGAMQRLGYSR